MMIASDHLQPDCSVIFHLQQSGSRGRGSPGNARSGSTLRHSQDEGSVSFSVMVMKMQEYTLKELFDKELLFLLPFYIFTYEKQFPIYENDAGKLQALKNEYSYITKQLENLEKKKKITTYTRKTILEMTRKVIENIARKYDRIREGVESVMGGKILEYEAKTILNQGLAEGKELGKKLGLSEGKELGKKLGLSEGKELGLSEGKKEDMRNMLALDLPIDIISKVTGFSEEEIKNYQEELKTESK